MNKPLAHFLTAGDREEKPAVPLDARGPGRKYDPGIRKTFGN
jgi:hypothetical protein